MLTEKQETQRLKCARELLETYKGCNSRVISNLLTSDETWVHMFEPQRSHKEGLIISNGSEKIKKMPVYCQETHKFEKRCCMQVSLIVSWPVVQVPCPSGQTVTGRFHKNSVLKKVKAFYKKKRPSKVGSGVHLLHDNASFHKCEVVKSFWLLKR